MIILGDIASPTKELSTQLKRVFDDNKSIFVNQTLVCNLEGLINDTRSLKDNTPVLFNHSSVINVLKSANTKAVGLANNHTLDLPESFDSTVNILNENSINFAGGGKSKEAASEPVFFKNNNKDYILFNFCWDFLLYHQKNPANGVYIAEINELQLINDVEKCKNDFPDAAIIIFLHWSFDLETLPFPMYRQFSKKLIDSGANVVAGCHSHCVQGGEKYKDGYIVYGLGNFFIPYNTFANGKLTFPEFSRTELAFEWNPESNEAKCHWFRYENFDNKHILKYEGSENFDDSELLKSYSPYQDMPDEEYLVFYKTNRRKKFLIPLYKDYNNTFSNKISTGFLKTRARFARFLTESGMRKWQK